MEQHVFNIRNEIDLEGEEMNESESDERRDVRTNSYRGESCLVGGHHFVQRGSELIDEAAEENPNAQHIRVRFDSLEYFELLAKYPKTFPAFKGARKVTLAVGDNVYEVYV